MILLLTSKRFFFFAGILSFCFLFAGAQETTIPDSAAIMNMSLEELMNLKGKNVSSELEKMINSMIEVASKKPLSTRKTPSIVTLITRDEIEKSGARDLIDVLRLVPGIDFGLDVWGIVGIGIRGNWAHEGKVLVLLDGQEMNEILYSTTQFGNHFSIDQIKKIEVIRGPGSAIYGGYSEFGVINIVTRDGEDINGISISGTYGQLTRDFGRRNINLSLGQKVNDFQYSLSAFTGQGNRSDQNFADLAGAEYNMGGGNSALNPTNINLGLSYKALSMRVISDDYLTTTRSFNGYDVGKAYPDNFHSRFAELKYIWNVNSKLSITPKINYKNQTPWQTVISNPDSIDAELYSNTNAQRTRGNVTVSYDPFKHINIITGAEVFEDRAKLGSESSDVFTNGKSTISYLNSSGFIQALAKYRFSSFTLGARYDNNSAYGSAFVPRIGITKRFDKFNLKVLYSGSFRAPGIYNVQISYNGNIKPEKSNVLELEASYHITKGSIFSVNVFDISTKSSIVYFADEFGGEGYKNAGNGGSDGIEAEYKIKEKWGGLDIAYSFYTIAFKNIVPDYEVPDNSKNLLAFASHKITANGTYNFSEKLSANSSLIFFSKRYGFDTVDSLSNGIIKEFRPILLTNVFLNYNNALVKGLNLGIGCYDLFDQKIRYIQPYNGGHPSIPGTGREIVLKVGYTFNYRKGGVKG